MVSCPMRHIMFMHSFRSHLSADYTMMTSMDSFIQFNAAMIADATRARSTQHYQARLV
jgi:hypothetical protein